MSESRAAYQGDEAVEQLLRKAGSRYGAADLPGLLAGVAAAPEAADPEAWIDLLAGNASEALKAQLRAYRADMAANTAAPQRADAAALQLGAPTSIRASMLRRGPSGWPG